MSNQDKAGISHSGTLAWQNHINRLNVQMIHQIWVAILNTGPHPVGMNQRYSVPPLGGCLNEAPIGMVLLISNCDDSDIHNRFYLTPVTSKNQVRTYLKN
jgi:hypothetical protein